MKSLALLAVGALTSLVACTHGTGPIDAPPEEIRTTPAIVFAAGTPCIDERNIEADAMRSAQTFQSALRDLGFSPVQLIKNPTAQVVRDSLREAGNGRLLVAYSGHATLLDNNDHMTERCPKCGDRCRSAICLDDGVKLPVDELVQAVPSSAKLVTFVLDACSSAHVEVRHAPAPVSVLSASPFSTKLSLGRRTPLSEAFQRFPKDGDLDWDGKLSDWELFVALNRGLQGGAMTAAQPKLRRQVTVEVPLLDKPRGLRRWPSQTTRDTLMPDHTGEYSCGSSRRLRIEGVWHAGEPGDVAIPCEHDTGQCFRERVDQACADGAKGEACDAW